MRHMTGTYPTSTATGTALLDGLHDHGNDSAWTTLVERFHPVLTAFAERAGLSGPDAEDVAQLVLMELARSYAAYDRTKGRLRQWLFGIARNQIANCKRRRAPEHTPQRDTRTTAFFDRLPGAPGELERAWQVEWDRYVMDRCLDQVREEVTPQTMEAFHQFAVLSRPAAEVARELGMTENAVFGAKRRVLSRMRELVAAFEQGE